jgi:hypothetical protein
LNKWGAYLRFWPVFGQGAVLYSSPRVSEEREALKLHIIRDAPWWKEDATNNIVLVIFTYIPLYWLVMACTDTSSFELVEEVSRGFCFGAPGLPVEQKRPEARKGSGLAVHEPGIRFRMGAGALQWITLPYLNGNATKNDNAFQFLFISWRLFAAPQRSND